MSVLMCMFMCMYAYYQETWICARGNTKQMLSSMYSANKFFEIEWNIQQFMYCTHIYSWAVAMKISQESLIDFCKQHYVEFIFPKSGQEAGLQMGEAEYKKKASQPDTR